MLRLSNSIIGQSVLSLRTGGLVARVEKAIINPHNLKVEGFYVRDSRSSQLLVLLVQDVRDLVPAGVVIDDHDVLTLPDELIRLQKILEMQYELIGKPVHTKKKQKVGKVRDYAVDDQSFYIQKLYVERSFLKSFSGGQLSIDRVEIVEVTNRRVIIKELNKPSKSGAPVAAPAT